MACLPTLFEKEVKERFPDNGGGQSQFVEWQFSTGLPTKDGYEIEKVPTLNRVWQGRIKMTNKVVAVAACCPRGVLRGTMAQFVSLQTLTSVELVYTTFQDYSSQIENCDVIASA